MGDSYSDVSKIRCRDPLQFFSILVLFGLHSPCNKLMFAILVSDNGVFPKWSKSLIEFNDFSEFRESDKSLKYDLGSSLKFLSVTCVLLVLRQHPDLLHNKW